MSNPDGPAQQRGALYRTIWRWHFYAGLFVMPFILILSVTGAIYLFKPQIDRWEESRYLSEPVAQPVSPNEQLGAAIAAFPGAQFHSYRLPESSGGAAMVHLALPDGRTMRDVFVSPEGKVLGSRDPEATISTTVSRIHGSLLIGKVGDWLVELAACWAIVMVLTGLYLWWPTGRRAAGVIWPRLTGGRRVFWRDLHAVTGFWVSGFALILLVSGLPWAGVWGDAFRIVRTEMGWVKGAQDWKTGAEHAEHDHDAMMRQQAAGIPMTGLADIVAKAKLEKLPFPTVITAPGVSQGHGRAAKMAWTVRVQSQNRPINRAITYDVATGEELSREGFADKHVIDRVVNYGIAWHEGQLFGWVNQLVGVLTALALVTLMVSGFIMWRRRKPDDLLGAPPLPAVPRKIRGLAAIVLVLAVFLPLLALSLLSLWAFERLVLPHSPKLSLWLGVTKPQPA
jgi:uncharacterized iron-regulated membrane protein